MISFVTTKRFFKADMTDTVEKLSMYLKNQLEKKNKVNAAQMKKE